VQNSRGRASWRSVVAKGGDRYEAQGKLTIRDVHREPPVLPFTLAVADDPAQPGRLPLTAKCDSI